MDYTGLPSGRWVHVAFVTGKSVSPFLYRHLFLNGVLVSQGTAFSNPGVHFGGFSIGVPSLINTSSAVYFPNGGRIAYPRYWDTYVDGNTINAIYHHERSLLGLPINH